MGVIVGAVATVFSTVVSIMSMQDGGPNIGSPPAPANYYQYDEDGNLTSSQTWNEDKHAFEYRENPKPEPSVEKIHTLSEAEDSAAWARAEQEVLSDRTSQWGSKDTWDQWQLDEYKQRLDNRRQEIYLEMLSEKRADARIKAEQDPQYQARLAEWQKGADARKKDKQLRTEIRTKMLENLNQTPEDRVAAYEQYAKTFSESMQKGVTEQYEKAKQSQEESMTARGLTGSRAYVDTMAEMEKEKLKADVDIAAKGEMAKHELANVDRNYWLNVLNSLDAGARADAVVGMQKAQAANQAVLGGTASIMGRYAAESQNQWNKWNADTAKYMGISNNLTNTSRGLMYLWGYGGRGGGSTPTTNAGTINNVGGEGMYGLYG